ncbi:MAG: PDZ domain-containing protein, partial [Fimbriimonadaceae bacterium]|nr:PDZ domain-containing protein [Fimbriimonadaceae bacterium]
MKEQAKSMLWAMAVLASLAAFLIGATQRRSAELGLETEAIAEGRGTLIAGLDDGLQIGDSEYFYQLMTLLDKWYVDGVEDEQKLAIGAVRGMITSLADPSSSFFTPEQFQAHLDRRQGRYSGIGAEFTFDFDAQELERLRARSNDINALMLIPELRVTMVAPGSPAERAGLRAGDVITEIDGRALISSRDVRNLQDLQKRVAEGKADRLDLEKAREEFRTRYDTNIPAGRGREKLITGTGKTLKVSWRRGDESMAKEMTTALTKVKAAEAEGEAVRLRFITGAEKEAERLARRSSVTLDLRGSGEGDLAVLQSVLEVIAAPGPFGEVLDAKESPPRPLVVEKGTPNPPKLNLLVDSTTRGAAEIFALALSSRGQAK